MFCLLLYLLEHPSAINCFSWLVVHGSSQIPVKLLNAIAQCLRLFLYGTCLSVAVWSQRKLKKSKQRSAAAIISCVQRLSDYHSLTLISFLRSSWNSSKWSLLHFCKSCMPSRSCVLRFAIWILSLCSRLIQRLNVLAFTPCLYLTELWTL